MSDLSKFMDHYVAVKHTVCCVVTEIIYFRAGINFHTYTCIYGSDCIFLESNGYVCTMHTY